MSQAKIHDDVAPMDTTEEVEVGAMSALTTPLPLSLDSEMSSQSKTEIADPRIMDGESKKLTEQGGYGDGGQAPHTPITEPYRKGVYEGLAPHGGTASPPMSLIGKWQSHFKDWTGSDGKISTRVATQIEILKRLEARIKDLTQLENSHAIVIDSHQDDKRGPHKVIATKLLTFPRLISFEQPLCASFFNSTKLLTTPDLFEDLAVQIYKICQRNKFDTCKQWFEQHHMTMPFKPLNEMMLDRASRLTERLSCDKKEAILLIQGVGLYSVNMWSSVSAHSLGRAIYPLLSVMNHSCKPNSMSFFQPNGSVAIICTDAIRRGGEITTSYARDLLTRPPGFRINDLPTACSFQCICKVCRAGKISIGPLYGLALTKPNGAAFNTLLTYFSKRIYDAFRTQKYITAGIEISNMFKQMSGLYATFMKMDAYGGRSASHTPMTEPDEQMEEQGGHEKTKSPLVEEPQALSILKAKERAIDQFLPMLAFCVMNASCSHLNPSKTDEKTTQEMEKKFSSLSLDETPGKSKSSSTDASDESDESEKPCHWSQETMLDIISVFLCRDYTFGESATSAQHQVQIANGTMLCFYQYIQMGYSIEALGNLPYFKSRKNSDPINEIFRRFQKWASSLQHWSLLTFSTQGGLRAPVTNKLLHFATLMASFEPAKCILMSDFYFDDIVTKVHLREKPESQMLIDSTKTDLYEDESPEISASKVEEFKKEVQKTVKEMMGEKKSDT